MPRVRRPAVTASSRKLKHIASKKELDQVVRRRGTRQQAVYARSLGLLNGDKYSVPLMWTNSSASGTDSVVGSNLWTRNLTWVCQGRGVTCPC